MRVALILLIFCFILSCRTLPDNERVEGENISLGAPVSVKINFLGTEWMSDISKNTQLSENQLVGGG